MNLVIVESPTKGNTIAKFLGPKFKVLSSYGHFRDLPKSELGIDIENDFQPKYIIMAKARKNLNLLKKEAQKADSVTLATDEDREGEAIAWHLSQALELNETKKKKSSKQKKIAAESTKTKSCQRIVFHEITKEAISAALKNPRDIDINLVNAQQVRRILDRIVGYKLSPFLWKKVARGLSAGRVQSVAVRLVADREKEIKNFVAQEYWTITALLQKLRDGEFEAVLVKKNSEVISKMGITTEKEAKKIVQDLDKAEYKVLEIEKKEVKRNPLPPFTTSTLQQESWKKFHWPAKFTMKIAQQLYEKGYSTYHRTDSLNLSDLSLFAAKKFILEKYGENYWAGFLRKHKTKSKGAQEAHEAIRPTFADKTPEALRSKLDDNNFRLYDLIWRRFLACQMAQAVFDATVIDIGAKNTVFRANGQILKFDGFLKVYPIKYQETELPPLKKEELLKLLKLTPSQHFTEPPPRYTEATLIKALEENGIGRPSTYAPILATVQERNYIEKDEQKRFLPTEIGNVVNDLLIKHFPEIVDINFTATLEEDLDKIAEGEKQWLPVIREFYTPFAKNLQDKYEEVSKKEVTEKPTEKTCPKCGAPLLMRLGKFGKFYACSKFPECKYTESLEKNNLGIKCPKCEKAASKEASLAPLERGKIVEKRTKKGKIFYGCDQFPKCDFALWDRPTNKKCPKCDSLLVETKRKQIRCSNKDCQFTEKVAE